MPLGNLDNYDSIFDWYYGEIESYQLHGILGDPIYDDFIPVYDKFDNELWEIFSVYANIMNTSVISVLNSHEYSKDITDYTSFKALSLLICLDVLSKLGKLKAIDKIKPLGNKNKPSNDLDQDDFFNSHFKVYYVNN